MAEDIRKGTIKTGALTSIVAAGAGGQQTVYTRTTGRTMKLKKVMAYNGQAADIILEIGSLDAVPVYTRIIPRMRVVAGFDRTLGELECPEWEFQTISIAARASAAAAAPADVEIQVTVEELG